MTMIQTARLRLHPLSFGDAQRIVDARPAPGELWAEGYPGVGDTGVARAFLAGIAERGDPGVYRPYAIRLDADGLVIGGIGFHRPPGPDGVVTVGYGLVPAFRGQGYASESLRGLIGRAREAGATAVRGDADLDNIPSQRVMEAAGMVYEGEDDKVRNYRVVFQGAADAT
ncbi:acetyltransferase [Streptomyces showdoensis]|uniref:Acetyltransferase n=1 Tax=Streptomyces showdoensis TaxID=68268 RepID=A0A2P2GJ20_STREW|nr:GNAT family N-acetyltransferase [Streptomyces showdoensis]KKZ71516.1 acetyltransferase [Streptomyces showdoensis]